MMKKQLFSLVCFLLGAAMSLGCYLLVGYLRDPAKRDESPALTMVQSDSVQNEELTRLALSVADTIRRGDFKALSSYIHPIYGLVFSPYSTINLNSNQCFTVNRVAIAGADTALYTWGTTVDSGEPIQLTTRQYFAQYVYDRDYANAPVIGFNTVVRQGNMLENITASFPEAQFVDLYYPPSSTDGTDWSILRMVFEDADGTLKLSALIHSSYTD